MVDAAPSFHRLELGGFLRYERAWLDAAEADALLAELQRTVPWAQGKLAFFGREATEPRLTAWFGDADYTYSGRTMRAVPWPASLAALRERVERSADAPMNAVLLNLYRDGNDRMGKHSDDEPELGPEPVIASVSLGATRRFVLEPKKKSARAGRTYELALEHGSLLVMGGPCQHRYRHGVPRDPACKAARVNLTFRCILPARATG